MNNYLHSKLKIIRCKLSSGFTLIELLVVIVIIGIISVVVIGLISSSSQNQADDSVSKSEVQEIQTALEQFYVKNETYPETATWIDELNTAGYLEGMVVDEYSYDKNGNGAGCYSVSYTLLNPNDQGINVTNGVYTLTCKQ